MNGKFTFYINKTLHPNWKQQRERKKSTRVSLYFISWWKLTQIRAKGTYRLNIGMGSKSKLLGLFRNPHIRSKCLNRLVSSGTSMKLFQNLGLHANAGRKKESFSCPLEFMLNVVNLLLFLIGKRVQLRILVL